MRIVTDIIPVELAKTTTISFKVVFKTILSEQELADLSEKLWEEMMKKGMVMWNAIGKDFIEGFLETSTNTKSVEENVFGFIESIKDLDIEVLELCMYNRLVLPE